MRLGDHDDFILGPFVRYKQHVDSTLAYAHDAMFGPSGFDPRRADSTDWHNTPQPLSAQIRSLLWSPYHPAHLRDLPQPVPKDLPNGAEPIFTFEDAFEDLLAVSQGQPLPDIHEKLNQRKLLKQVFPKGEPRLFWMRRLDSQGLVPSSKEDSNERGMGRQRQSRVPEPKPQDWERLHSELAQRRDEAWSAEPRNDAKRDDAPNLADILKLSIEILKSNPELEKRLEQMNQNMFEDIFGKRPQMREDATLPSGISKDEQPTADKVEKKHPNTFDELFDHVQNFQTEATSSWDAFKKSLEFGREMIEAMTKEPRDGRFDHSSDGVKGKMAELDQSGLKGLVKELLGENEQQISRTEPNCTLTIKEHSELKDGMWHVKKTWTKMDEQGKLVDSWEENSLFQEPQQQDHSTRSDDALDGRKSDYERGYPADNGEVRKPGWFWK